MDAPYEKASVIENLVEDVVELYEEKQKRLQDQHDRYVQGSSYAEDKNVTKRNNNPDVQGDEHLKDQTMDEIDDPKQNKMEIKKCVIDNGFIVSNCFESQSTDRSADTDNPTESETNKDNSEEAVTIVTPKYTIRELDIQDIHDYTHRGWFKNQGQI